MAKKFSIDRRQVLTGTTAVAGAAALGLSGSAALARAPFALTQSSYWYRFPIGKFQATVVSDGPLPLGKPADTMKGVPEADLAKALGDNFLPTDAIVLEQNVLVLNTGSRLVMFDSGMGFSKAFGTTTGRLLRSLRDAGIRPDQIDDVICTHAHIDHIGGLSNARGERLFPNATIHISEVDHKFWTDPAKVDDKTLGAFIKHARANLVPYGRQVKFVTSGKEVVPGVQAMAAPGHTAGHTIYLIESDGKKLAFTGDVTHHQILLTEKPRTEFAYDMDPKQAVETRLRVFDMLSRDRIPLLAFHFPWPGYGYIGRTGAETFRYYPTPMTIVPQPPAKKS
jgi:glyoxylase-like metal-dependent hydrolase (beta-lactamase superfamily II)